MRKFKSKINKTIKEVIIIIGFFAAICFLYLISVIPSYAYLCAGIVITIGLFLWNLLRPENSKTMYINERGYVFLIKENDLEHRYIAKNLLNRELNKNEIVHHINGKKTDNSINNLCLMDHEKHELFHSWLSWKKRKSGRYPSFNEQKRILTNEYGGTLLELVPYVKPIEEQSPAEMLGFKDDDTEAEISKMDTSDSKKLFEELRKERLRIAREENIPAYAIFHDKTLHKLVQNLPDTNESMLKMLGPSIYQKYGHYFIPIIKQFKDRK